MSAYEQDGASALQASDVVDPALHDDSRTGGARTGGARTGGARRRPTRGQLIRAPLLLAAPILIILVALYLYLSGGRFVKTDDAFVQSARVSISTQVPGQVSEMDVRENQFVHTGQILFRLDSRAFDVAAEQADAQLASAQQAIQSSQASYGQQGAQVQAAQATLAYDLKELARQQAMTASGVSSQQQLDAAAHAVDEAKAGLASAQQQQASLLANLGGQAGGAVGGYAGVRQAQAAVDRAKLNQSYTVIRAPQDGIVTRVEQLQVGEYVNPAQPLFELAAPRLWVEANFKENQLAYMRPGQPATVKIDAYPGHVYHLHVASLSPGTGNSFSVLPPENATGNWVKVVQRLPVRLVFDEDTASIRVPLAAGLSASVSVDTAHRRTLLGYGLNHRARSLP